MDGITRRILENKSGFTLIELMVALAMAAFFIMATMTLAEVSTKSYRAQERVSNAQQNLRAAMDLMVRDIRMAGYDPMANSKGRTDGVGILVAGDHKLRFGADLNADGAITIGREDMTYFYEAGTRRLRQKEGGAAFPQTFIEDVSALRFAYLDSNGNDAAGLDDIVMVVVSLTVEDRDQKAGTFQRSLTTRINCRNLRM